jgi:hypothetical protein
MRKLIVTTCAAALMSAVSFGTASAQTTGPAGGRESSMKTDSPMNAQAKMTKKKQKMSSKKNSSMTTGSSGSATNTTGGAASMNSKK